MKDLDGTLDPGPSKPTSLLEPLLKDGRVQAVRLRRENRAARAREAEAQHQRLARLFVVATCLAALAGALILYGIGGEVLSGAGASGGEAADVAATATTAAQDAASGAGSGAGATTPSASLNAQLMAWLSSKVLRSVLVVGQILSLAMAAYAASQLRDLKLSQVWTSERRAAELGRIGLFETLLAVGEERGPQTYAAAFEHFLKEQLDGQIAYFAKAEARHRRGMTQTTRLASVVAAAVAGTGAAAGLSGIWGEIWLALAALIGVVTPMLGSALQSWRETTLDAEKAERYRAAWDALMALKGEADQAQAALTKGDLAPAKSLVARVHAVLRAEAEAWVPTRIRPELAGTADNKGGATPPRDMGVADVVTVGGAEGGQGQ